MPSPSFILPAFASWAFLVGASVGSFLNVCIYRLPRNESVVFPASHCPWCNTRLRLTDLVPLVSQLVLRSRCRYCGQWFSWRYFGVELLTGLCFAGLAWRYGFTWQLLPYAVLTAALLAAVFTDLDSRISSLEGGVRNVVDQSSMEWAMDCLGNGSDSADRFPADLAAAEAAAHLEAPPTAAADSEAAGILAVRITAIHSMNWGCESCGGLVYDAALPVDWDAHTVSDGVEFEATFDGGVWEIVIFAC